MQVMSSGQDVSKALRPMRAGLKRGSCYLSTSGNEADVPSQR